MKRSFPSSMPTVIFWKRIMSCASFSARISRRARETRVSACFPGMVGRGGRCHRQNASIRASSCGCAFSMRRKSRSTVLYPNEGLNIGLQRDGDWAVGLARAYNDWLHHDFLSVSPRFQGVALLAPQKPQEAARELERAVRDLGMVAGMLPGVMSPMKGLGLPEFDPIYHG